MKNKKMKKTLMSLFSVFALIVLILFYTNYTIEAEIDEAEILVTKVDIPPRTAITEDMLESIIIPSRGIPTRAITDPDEIVGKYTVAGFGIPANSFIYEDKVINENQMPDAGILQLDENEVAFPLLVDLETSLGNSIIPETQVDLYFKTMVREDNDNNTKAIYGKLASNIKVVSVKDADASNVFDPEEYNQGQQQNENNNQKKTLAKIYIFALPNELNQIVNKAKMIGQVVPVATGSSSESEIETEMEQNEILDYIESASYSKKETADQEQVNEEGE